MTDNELEKYLAGIRHLAHELGELLADRIRKNPDTLEGITRGLSLVATAASSSGWCCNFQTTTVCPMDPSTCLGSHGTPTYMGFRPVAGAEPTGLQYLQQTLATLFGNQQ